MKRCPKCSRTYADDNQKFCTVDGGRLETANNIESASALSATIITNQDELNLPPDEPAADLNKTMAALPPPPTGEIRSGNTGRTDNRTIITPFQPADSPSQQPPPPSSPQPQSPPQSYQPARPDYQQQPPPQQPPAYGHGQPQQQQQQQQPYQQYQQQQYQQSQPAQPSHMPAPVSPSAGHMPPAGQRTPAAAAAKGSRLPLIIGAVVLLLLAGAAAYYFLVLNKKDDAVANTNSNANTANANSNANANAANNTNANANASANANANVAPPFEPPPNTTQFVNSRANLTGKIAERFAPFSFYYPNSWELNTGIASEGTYFVRVERKLPPNYVQERFTVGWYESNGTYESDESLFPNLVAGASTNLSKLPGYEKLSEGPTKVNSMNAYEITFKGLSENTDKGDVTYWGRVIFLPPGVEGRKTGLQLTILTSSLATELEGIEDVGVKGELPVILESFRLK
jgi:hypothetical protein